MGLLAAFFATGRLGDHPGWPYVPAVMGLVFGVTHYLVATLTSVVTLLFYIVFRLLGLPFSG